MSSTTSAAEPHEGIGFREFIALMAASMAINALAIDMMLPALPQVGMALGVEDENTRQLVITAYLLGFGVAQLFYGPMSDILGRKHLLVGGVGIYVIFGLFATFASSFEQLMLARALQGVGAAATRVISISIVRDCYGGRRMASVMSLIMLVFVVVPVVAPSLGQIIVIFAPWRWLFGFLTVLGLIVFTWAAIRLPETLPPERRLKSSVRSVIAAYREALTNRIALGYALATALVLGGLFGFINSAQQVFVEIFDTGVFFPVAFASIALFMALSSYVNSKVVERLGMRLVSHSALVGFVGLSLLHTILILSGIENLWSFLLIQAATMFCFGFVMSNFNAMAMEPLGHIAGAASSALGFWTTVGGALCGYVIGQRYDGTTLPLAAGFAILGALALVLVFLTEGGRLFHARNVPAE
ncbi:Sulfonamide resistance protein [Hartmannibacter diazotrophicus]|uniref:Bcr/CflA family efflux transporter n=1 Tax=Hartmannibacter diazotrophicus TaxID=1482074 RepID=A0A2C9D9N8_9HYPH|nr:multidrug effflux MFS transporter [Hartmannibacter diazotrophicus]SON57044.1 Sulfonamide resistance protein [Hartmannibacter diazotrophicus]